MDTNNSFVSPNNQNKILPFQSWMLSGENCSGSFMYKLKRNMYLKNFSLQSKH